MHIYLQRRFVRTTQLKDVCLFDVFQGENHSKSFPSGVQYPEGKPF